MFSIAIPMILVIYIFNFFSSFYTYNVIIENAQLVLLYIKNNDESFIEGYKHEIEDKNGDIE